MNLVQRHEQSFYHFVHNVHSKGEGLFDSLMRWIELFLTFVREGLGPPLSLEFLLPAQEKERAKILAEVDKIATYHYKLKVLYEGKIRRRFGRAQTDGEKGADAEDEAAKELVSGVLGEINFGELVRGDAVDLAALDTDEEGDESSIYDSDEESEETSSEVESTESSTPVTTGSERGGSHSATLPARDRLMNQHQASGSTSSLGSSSSVPAATPPPPRPTPRKRSMSLKNVRSFTSLLGKDKVRTRGTQSDVPPVPPLPAVSQAQISSSRPNYLRTSSQKTIQPGLNSSSSSYHSASASTSSLPKLDVGSGRPEPKSPLEQSAYTDYQKKLPNIPDPDGEPVGEQNHVRSHSSATASSAHSIAGSSAEGGPRSAGHHLQESSSSVALSQEGTPQQQAKVEQTKKKKAQPHATLEPPQLSEIPKLLPVFVEMVSVHSI